MKRLETLEKPSIRPFLIAMGCFLAGCSLVGCHRAKQYPSRPITVVCPWSVGGGTDRVSRQMAAYLEHELGVPVNVINATGGRGVTGHSRSLMARADGYTIGTITFELNTLHWQHLTDIDWQDAEPLMSVNEDAAAVWVRDDAPWKSLDELVANVRREPGSLTASGTANGGAWHLALAGWLQAIEQDPAAIRWIPMGGAGPSMQELVSGGIDIVCCSLPEARELYRSGTVRCLGVMAEERVPGFAQIPTMREQGMDWVLVGWRGFAVPLGTDPDRVALLAQTMTRIVSGDVEINGKTFPEFMAQQGFNLTVRTRDEFREFLRTNDGALGNLITSEAFRQIGESQWDAMTWPKILAALAVILAAGLALQRFRIGAVLQPSDRDGTAVVNSPVNAVFAVLAVGFYLLASETLGFIICGCLIAAILLWKLGTRLHAACLIACLFVPIVYVLFAQLMRVPLPRGVIDL